MRSWASRSCLRSRWSSTGAWSATRRRPTATDGSPLPVPLREVAEHVDAARRVAPLVVVPRHDLEELVVELDAGLRVEDAAARITDEIRRHDLVLGVAEHAGHRAFGCGLH